MACEIGIVLFGSKFIYVNKRNSGCDKKPGISYSLISVKINPLFTAFLTYNHISENAFLQLSSLTRRELLNPGFLRRANQTVGAVAMECSFHKADLSLACLLDPAVNVKSRHRQSACYKYISSRCPNVL